MSVCPPFRGGTSVLSDQKNYLGPVTVPGSVKVESTMNVEMVSLEGSLPAAQLWGAALQALVCWGWRGAVGNSEAWARGFWKIGPEVPLVPEKHRGAAAASLGHPAAGGEGEGQRP